MTERATHHATFTIERTYPAPPAHAFRAWSDQAAKARWFACHDDWKSEGHELDFRVGGSERLDTYPSGGGAVHAYRATYFDIVPDQRIVYAYDMYLGETRISVSLATVELEPAGAGTLLRFTEQVVMLDGYEDDNAAGREEGTRAGLENLARELERADVSSRAALATSA
jgi:uncharacterized protein YndB with AHSA1/START domain